MPITVDNTHLVVQTIKVKTLLSLEKIGQIVEDLIPKYVPVRTGATRDSRAHIVTHNCVEIGVQTFYAKYLELGTSKMAARPFLRPALMEALPLIDKAFKSE